MTRKKRTVKDLREKEVGSLDRDKDTHESYAMVSLARQSWGGTDGVALFGSKIKHNNVISLQIHRAERSRNMYYERYFPRDKVIEILLSPAQFTSMLTMMNTSGSPCTLSWVDGEPVELPPEHNTIDELKDDLSEKYKKLAKTVQGLKSEIDELLKGTVKKADKDAIKSAVHTIYNDVSSNIIYLRKCQHEKLETMVSEAKAEVESTMVTTLINAGLEHIKVGNVEMTTVKRIERDEDE